MKQSLLLFTFLLISTVALAQPRKAYHTKLLAHLDPVAPGSGIRYSALTGYAAPDGREYAIVGGVDGTYIVDVTGDPIRLVSFIPGARSIWREMKTYRTYAYVVSEGTNDASVPQPGLQIIDLSKLPDSARLVRTDVSIFPTAHTIDRDGDYLYVNGTAASAGANGGTIVYDLSQDPLHPRRVGTWSAHYVHDAAVRNDTLYAAAIYDGVLDIVYLGQDRTNPKLVAEIRYPDAGTHNADVVSGGGYVMTTDEIHDTPKTLKVWDIRDLDNITKVADYTPVPGQIVHNVHTKGRYAFVSWYTAGTRIIDMTDPRDPVQVGFYDTSDSSGSTMDGNWEVYPYLPSGKILAGDMQTGLYVFAFDGAVRAKVSGSVIDAETGSAIPLADIRLPDLGLTVYSDSQGKYVIESAADTLPYVAVKSGYYATDSVAILTSDGGRTQNIYLRPLHYSTVTLRAHDSATGEPITSFSWRIMNRAMDGTAKDQPATLSLVIDSTYDLYVGVWGHVPKLVEVSEQGDDVVDVPLAHGYADDAELDLGWSLAAPGDSATRGLWEWGVPIRTGLDSRAVQPGWDHTADPGDRAFITGIATTSPTDITGNCVRAGNTSLTTPLMDLSGYRAPVIRCALWYVNDGNRWVDDTLAIEVSSDGGASWHLLDEIPTSFPDWTPVTLRLRGVVEPTARMLFRVVASESIHAGTLFGSTVEAGVDDFSVVDDASSSVAGTAVGSAELAVTVRPNPIAGRGLLDLRVGARQDRLTVALFDMLGRCALTLHDGPVEAGMQSLAIDGAALAPGAYMWHATASDGAVRSGVLSILR